MWETAAATDYSIRIVTCGYEERATYVYSGLSGIAHSTIVLDYECAGALSYDANRVTLTGGNGNIHVLRADPSSLRVELTTLLEMLKIEMASDDDPLTVLFDVSSCSRSVMAAVFLSLSDALKERASVTCTYALSAFDEPPLGEMPSSISEPVIGDLSGWSDDLSKPPCAIIALGFEPGRALGCIDYLEVPEVRLFLPRGPDQRFEVAVENANKVLIKEAGSEAVLPYNVMEPAATYQKLESLVFGLMPRFRPVIIPLGPKIFSAVCLVLSIRLFPNLCVWRTSSGSGGEIRDIRPSGLVSTFVYHA